LTISRIRPTGNADLQALHRLYPAAFANEDLLPLVDSLLSEVPDLVSLAAESGGELVGSIFFTPCSVAGATSRIALLGPMAVHPKHQGEGLGTAMIRQGLCKLEARGFVRVQVLGDPRFYGRVGFVEDGQVVPPFPLNPAWVGAWQALPLEPGHSAAAGTLVVPRPWQVPSLWS
jgi:putative acetyltransferase